MKKSILTFIGIMVAAVTLFASNPHTVSLKVKNLKNTEGKLIISLFESENDWLEKGVEKVVVIDNASEVIIFFDNLPTGTYAISVVHDENGNGDLDTGMFGIPTEEYGFSNDAKGTFGPASFKDSKFEVNGDKELVININ